MKIAKYSLLAITPIPERMDQVAVGVVVKSDDAWKIEFTSSFGKVLAIDPNFSLSSFKASSELLEEMAGDFREMGEFRSFLSANRSFLQLDSFVGTFGYDTEEDFAIQIERIFAESVDSPFKDNDRVKRERSKLKLSLKSQFERLGLLGTLDDIEDHKVVPHYPIQPEQGLYAEFGLKNSVMHITETVDFTMALAAFTAKKYEAQAKCLVLKAATETCGIATKKYVVVKGATSKNAKSAINLLAANAALFNYESSDDMTKYLDAISSAAGRASFFRH